MSVLNRHQRGRINVGFKPTLNIRVFKTDIKPPFLFFSTDIKGQISYSVPSPHWHQLH